MTSEFLLERQQLIKQTVVKLKQFMTEDLKINDTEVNNVDDMLEKIKMINTYQSFILAMGRNNVTSYASKVIIDHYKLSEINKDQKQKLESFIDVLLELSL